jgi:hypothetical protein
MTSESGFYHCPYCHSPSGFVYVHGHYQCHSCGNNVNPCCGGETMDACHSFTITDTNKNDNSDETDSNT